MSSNVAQLEGRSPNVGHANYRGDVRHIVGEVKGPATFGENLTAVEATYDPTTDTTRVGFDFTHTTDLNG